MSKYSGADLLKVFAELNIETGHISDNVMKAWFDTDDQDMLHFLDSMCSLSKDNHVSPQEKAEYKSLRETFEGAKLDKEVDETEKLYPRIFNVQNSLFEIKLLENQVYLEENKGKAQQNSIQRSKRLEEDLVAELAQLNSTEIKVSVEKDQAQETCHKAGLKLDEINEELFEEIIKLSQNAEVANNFINIINLAELRKKCDSVISPLDNFVRKDSTSSINNTVLDRNSCSQAEEIRNRISSAKFDCFMEEIKAEKLKALQNYLNNFDVNKAVGIVNLNYLKDAVASKREEVEQLTECLKNTCESVADGYILYHKLENIKNEKNSSGIKLEVLKNICNTMRDLNGVLLVLNELYEAEQVNYSKVQGFFNEMFDYVTNSLRNCIVRTDEMSEVIGEFKKSCLKPMVEQFKLLRDITKLFKSDSLEAAFFTYNKTMTQIKYLQEKLFIGNPTRELREIQGYHNYELSKVRSLLSSGPTNRIVIIPQDLFLCFMEADDIVRNQQSSLKSVMEMYANLVVALASIVIIFSSTTVQIVFWGPTEKVARKKVILLVCNNTEMGAAFAVKTKKSPKNKWATLRRQLWMYFLINPEKFKQIMSELENEASLHKS